MDRLDSHADIACTLNDADFRDRRAFARQQLIPKISKVERIENGLIFRMIAKAGIEEDLSTFVELERQCCGFLTFTIIPDERDDTNGVALKIEGPPEASATLEMFAQAAKR